MIRTATDADADAIVEIYNRYIRETTITFEEEPLSRTQMAERVTRTSERYPYLVFVDEGRVVGYAYAGAFHARSAYRFTCESTIYLDPAVHRKGVGTSLYRALIDRLSETSLKVVVAGIALPNDASQSLHEKLGFRKVGHFERVGYKFDRWIDVGFWQLDLRRSTM